MTFLSSPRLRLVCAAIYQLIVEIFISLSIFLSVWLCAIKSFYADNRCIPFLALAFALSHTIQHVFSSDECGFKRVFICKKRWWMDQLSSCLLSCLILLFLCNSSVSECSVRDHFLCVAANFWASDAQFIFNVRWNHIVLIVSVEKFVFSLLQYLENYENYNRHIRVWKEKGKLS